MYKIKIFLASSEELVNDRNAFGNFVWSLDKQYEKRGIRIELFKWEEYDAAYNNRRKQDEYNEKVRASDMFLALFYKKAGAFTIEEFDVASAEFKRTGRRPKIYVYCRKVEEWEQESEELKAFKDRLYKELGHYWSNYDNCDSMKLHFVMQLLLVESNHLEELKLEDGNVRWGEITVAQMEKLRFAGDNADYRSKRRQIAEIQEQIEENGKHIVQYPEIDLFRQERQRLINRRSQLQEELNLQQELLFSTAKRIAELETGVITERMQRAIEAFNKGNVTEANTILREAEYDAQDNMRRYRYSKAVNEQDRQNVEKSIEELLFKTSTLMADTAMHLSERIQKTSELFAKIDEMADEIHYDEAKYSRLLYDYAKFLYTFGNFEQALGIVKRLLTMSPATVQTYNLEGNILYQLDDYQKALEVYDKALATLAESSETDGALLVETYNNIGRVYNRIGAYDKARENAQKALKTYSGERKNETTGAAKALENIAESLWYQGAGEKALTYYKEALEINKRIMGEDSIEVAINYRQIGESYRGISDNLTALEYYGKALEILEKEIGPRHPETALTYGCIGASNLELCRFKEALEYTRKGMEIREEILGTSSTQTSESYYWMGMIYSQESDIQDYQLAMEYYQKARFIRKKKYGLSHQETLNVDYYIGALLISQGRTEEATAYLKECLDKILAMEHQKPRAIATSLSNLGFIYSMAKEYDKAIASLNEAKRIKDIDKGTLIFIFDYLMAIHIIKGDYSTAIHEAIEAMTIIGGNNEEEKSNIAYMESRIGDIYFEIKDYEHALAYYDIALKDIEEAMGKRNPIAIDICEKIANVNYAKRDFATAIKHYRQTFDEQKKMYGENNRNNTLIYNKIGLSFLEQGDFNQAIEYFRKAVATIESIQGSNHLDSAIIYGNIGTAYADMRDFAQSAEYYLKELSIREKYFSDNPIGIATCNYHIGEAYEAQDKYSEALKYYLKALPTIEKEQGLEIVDIVEAYKHIGIMFHQIGKYGNAWVYFYKALTVMEAAPEKGKETLGILCYWTGLNFSFQGYHQSALDYLNQAYTLLKETLGETHTLTQSTMAWIEQVHNPLQTHSVSGDSTEG